MPQVCHAVDIMGDTRVLFKCATAVRLCAARVVHVLRHPEIPIQRTRASSVGKTPSFGFCQVDMYGMYVCMHACIRLVLKCGWRI